jgi:hypothetical protein
VGRRVFTRLDAVRQLEADVRNGSAEGMRQCLELWQCEQRVGARCRFVQYALGRHEVIGDVDIAPIPDAIEPTS